MKGGVVVALLIVFNYLLPTIGEFKAITIGYAA
jgi:hypothetical protein